MAATQCPPKLHSLCADIQGAAANAVYEGSKATPQP